MHLDHLPGTFFGPSTLVELLRHRAHCQAKDIAFTYLVDGENEQVHLTYEELDRQARAIGAWLQTQGRTGERALLLYPAGLDFIVAFFGCLYAGVVAVPVYPPRRNRSLARIQAIADDAEAKVALTTDLVLSRVEPLIDQTPHLKALTWLATCRVAEGMECRWQKPDVHGDTLAFLQYTSGSTGTPKGVMLNHANLVHNSALIAHAFEHSRSRSGVFWLPSYHDMGLIGGILQPLYIGRPNILLSPMSFLQKPYRWLSAISRFGGSTSGGPNFAYDLCVRKITPEQRKTLDLSGWKVAFNGAEPVRAETLDEFAETFAPCGFRREAFYPCYGLAEATLIVSGGYAFQSPVVRTVDAASLSAGRVADRLPDESGIRTLVGCGQNLPDQKIVIADPETMTACPPDRVGEIWVSGPSVAQGYWQQPQATEATFRARLRDSGEGPFLRTGDLGFIKDGELYVTGRIKDLIIIRGVNYYPQDIELTVQQSHPRLRPDCGAALNVDADGREQLVIVQEVERHKHGDLETILDAIHRSVAAEFELPVDVIVLVKAGSIPKTSSGKIQRHACRMGYLDGTLDAVHHWQAGETAQAAAAASPRASSAARRAEPAAVAAVGRPPSASHTPLSGGNGEDDAEDVAATGEKAAGGDGPEHGPPQRLSPTSKNGRSTLASRKRTTEVVLEEIRRVARERIAGMTLDSPIVDTGMDSLERMEILASLEERFGGRFPEEILPELETTRQLIEAVEKYLGTEPRPRAARPVEAAVPEENYRFACFPEYVRLRENLDRLESSGLGNPYFVAHQGVARDRTVIGGRELLSFSTYNYMGMSGDPVVSRAVKEAVDRYGSSASASRLVSGQREIHVELERAIAGFLGTEASLVFVGGHATNESVIGHLMGPGDLILHDALAHNSIIQGCTLSGARRRPFAHNDWRAADEVLRQIRHEYRRVLVAIEGVYSMDGDIPDLPRFIELKKRHKTLLFIDEAHSCGVLGPHGRGIGEYYGVDRGDVDIWMGTLSKSFGSCGGFIAGSKELIEYLQYTTPGMVFAAAMPPPAAAAALASLRLLEAEPERVARLRQRSELFLRLARERGLNTGMSQDSPVIPVILGNSLRCLRLSKALMARGINVLPILHPAVEESAARLRFFITTLHTEEQIRYTVEVTAEELKKILAEDAAAQASAQAPSRSYTS